MQIERNQAKKKTFYLASFIYNSIFSITTARISAIAWGWWGGNGVKEGLQRGRWKLGNVMLYSLS